MKHLILHYYVYEILGDYYAAIQQTDTAITYWQKSTNNAHTQTS